MTRFVESDFWQRLLHEADQHERHLQLMSHVRGLSVEDLEGMAALMESGTPAERDTALSFFYQMSHRGDSRVTVPLRKRLAPKVQALAREHYPRQNVGRMAFSVWRYVDKGNAYQFLNEIQMETLPEEHWFDFIVDLSLGTNRSLEKLREIQRKQPGWAARVERQLERAGLMAARRVATLSEEWKTTRSLKTLQKLQMSFLSNARNLPIHVVLEVMGDPDSNSGHSYTFFCFLNGARSGRVRLEADESGRFLGEEIFEEME